MKSNGLNQAWFVWDIAVSVLDVVSPFTNSCMQKNFFVGDPHTQFPLFLFLSEGSEWGGEIYDAKAWDPFIPAEVLFCRAPTHTISPHHPFSILYAFLSRSAWGVRAVKKYDKKVTLLLELRRGCLVLYKDAPLCPTILTSEMVHPQQKNSGWAWHLNSKKSVNVKLSLF